MDVRTQSTQLHCPRCRPHGAFADRQRRCASCERVGPPCSPLRSQAVGGLRGPGGRAPKRTAGGAAPFLAAGNCRRLRPCPRPGDHGGPRLGGLQGLLRGPGSAAPAAPEPAGAGEALGGPEDTDQPDGRSGWGAGRGVRPVGPPGAGGPAQPGRRPEAAGAGGDEGSAGGAGRRAPGNVRRDVRLEGPLGVFRRVGPGAGATGGRMAGGFHGSGRRGAPGRRSSRAPGVAARDAGGRGAPGHGRGASTGGG
mmetsp:Transcript_1171/g.3386  ORF Transcript_1171/g.3386 Transcript_1171/m.3386 type:complete len:252 (+) Transcript_1171:233-988(+)